MPLLQNGFILLAKLSLPHFTEVREDPHFSAIDPDSSASDDKRFAELLVLIALCKPVQEPDAE